MPYIAIKSFPKDEETKRKAVENVNRAIMDAFGCPQEYITISFENVDPDDWDEKVEKDLIEPEMDRVMIRNGVRTYE